MNYYSHNIGDYAQATMHLSLIEDAVYSRLLRRYYAEETPLVNDIAQLCRWVAARSEEEKTAVEVVLNEFFTLEGGVWRNKRADKEIEAYQAKSAKASESASKRWQGKEPARKEPSHSERITNAMPTHSDSNANQEPITNNQEPKEKTSKKPAPRSASLSIADLTALQVDEQVAKEFLAIRKTKRAPLTEIALAGIRREAEGVGWTLDQTLRKCVERGWQGFEAGWVTDKKTTGASRHGNFANQDYRAGVGADGSF